ncbi:putative protein [Methanobacterium congolense]|jgi:uncharacterized membrane protein|uniref:Uncharacterized protein n=2 Tax=Methanobacterium congolense TaxID=118062 RepID=A0A1D3L4D6_9EURY|nr:putative protein [Methanobacterium congolense]
MITTATTVTTAAATTVTTADVMTYSMVAVVALILFLALKEIMSSETENRSVRNFMKGVNVAIVPLLLVFVAIVAYKVVTVI